MVALDEYFHHKVAKARRRRRCGSVAARSETSLARRIIDVASPRRRDTSISSPNSCVKFNNRQSVPNSFVSLCRCGENRFRFIDHRPLIFKRSADAYGNTLIFTGPGPDGLWFTDDDVQSVYGANEIIYCGYRFDAETQLYYVRNRTYSPVLGRWIQRDPIGYASGINLYGYVEGEPTGNSDPGGTIVYALIYATVDITAGLGGSMSFGYATYDCGNSAQFLAISQRLGANIGIAFANGGIFSGCLSDFIKEGISGIDLTVSADVGLPIVGVNGTGVVGVGGSGSGVQGGASE